MATVSKEIADDIIAGKYDEDGCYKVVEYTSPLSGGLAYGALFEGDHPDKYAASMFIVNPRVYWESPNAPKVFYATLFVPPNGQQEKRAVLNIAEEDAKWFTDNNVEVSMEEIGGMVAVYATPPGKNGDDQIMVLSNGRECMETMADLRKQCEAVKGT